MLGQITSFACVMVDILEKEEAGVDAPKAGVYGKGYEVYQWVTV